MESVVIPLFVLAVARFVAAQEVLGIYPKYGPLAGGTEITISGQNLTNATAVILATVEEDVVFPILEVWDEKLICQSTNVSDELVDASFPLTVEFEFDLLINTTVEFTYRPDPVIMSIQPAKSTLDGGILQTVRGQNLDSVHQPEIRMILIQTLLPDLGDEYEQCANNECYDSEEEIVAQRCQVKNSTVMICRSKPFHNTPLPGYLPPYDPENGYNSDQFQIYVGLFLDGVTDYHNVTIIKIYPNPTIDHFDNDVVDFKVYKGHTTIDIWGNYLNLGPSPEDYRITVGEDGLCEVVSDELITNRCRCKPPQERPNTGPINQNGNPAVTVYVGLSPHQSAGYLKYEVKPWDDPKVRIAVITTVCVVIVVAAVIITVVLYRIKCMTRNESEERSHRPDYEPNQGLLQHVPHDLRAAVNACLKDQSRFKVGEQLGEGQFGSVHKGQYMGDDGRLIPVAAKTIKESGVTRQEFREFLEEATLMKDFNHPNVLDLVAVVFKRGRPFVLLPFMSNGDLRTYIRRQDKEFTIGELLAFGHQVAQGMAYLEASRCVHRDLAARNCMVSEADIVKVADFGLARDIFQEEYYKVGNMDRPLPIKWMAPECLIDHKFSSKSDVWAFGVLLWETMTRGKRPYQMVNNMELKAYVIGGNRLEQPDYLQDSIYAVMLACWQLKPELRPCFNDIVKMLDDILNQDSADVNDVDIVQGDPDEIEKDDLQEGRGYQNLSRYVDTEEGIHGYERMIGNSTGARNQDESRYINALKVAASSNTVAPPEDASNDASKRPVSGYLTTTERNKSESMGAVKAPSAGDENRTSSGYLSPSSSGKTRNNFSFDNAAYDQKDT